METNTQTIAAPQEYELPLSIYDIEISSWDGKRKNILSDRKGKVTLLFNVAAGCGNIPQHSVIEELNQKYKNNPDFSIIAVVVDDFVCHGYDHFSKGLEHYAKENNLDMTPSEVARNYAVENFNTTFEFTEITNGRFDKHTYDSQYVPGSQKLQDQHPLWWWLTGANEADLQENGVPYHQEQIPWSYSTFLDEHGRTNVSDFKACIPLRGNFEKFLIDRTGKKVKRYANGFLLGERGPDGRTFPWVDEWYSEDGRQYFMPKHEPPKDSKSQRDDTSFFGVRMYKDDSIPKTWPSVSQRKGIEFSLDLISRDIEEFLAK